MTGEARTGPGLGPALAVFVASIVASVPATSAAAPQWKVAVAAPGTGESAASARPAAPTGLVASCATTKGEITLDWTPVSHASAYTVYDSTTSSNGPYTTYASGVTSSTYKTGPLARKAGRRRGLTRYWFKVAAIVGNSWTSAQSSAGGELTVSANGTCH